MIADIQKAVVLKKNGWNVSIPTNAQFTNIVKTLNVKTLKENEMGELSYHTLKGEIESGRVWLDGEELDLKESLRAINHSPTGFAWGYGGSGPAQLAAAIMLKLTGSIEEYQDFKWNVIAGLPRTDFEIEFPIRIKGETNVWPRV